MRRLAFSVLLIGVTVGSIAQSVSPVLADEIVRRAAFLEELLSDYPLAQRFTPSTSSYYDSVVLPVPDSPIVIVCAIDAEKYVFDAVMNLAGVYSIELSGVPMSPLDGGDVALDSPVADSSTAHIIIAGGTTTEWYLGTGRTVTPEWLAESIIAGDGIHVSVPAFRILPSVLSSAQTGLLLLLENDIPAAYFTLAPSDSDKLASILGSIRNSFPLNRSEDVNYAVLPAPVEGKAPTIVRESLLVGGLFASIALLLLYAHIRPRRALRYIHALGRRLPIIVVFFVIMTLGLIAGNAILRSATGEHAASANPVALFALKVSVAAVTIGLFFRIFRVRLASSTTVYAAGAIIMLVVAVVITGVVSLSLSLYPVSMLVGAFLFSLAPRAFPKSVLLVATLIPPIYLLTGGPLGYDGFAVLLVQLPYWSEALVAVFVLPVFLMLLRLEYLTPRIALMRMVSLVSVIVLFLSAILVYSSIADAPKVIELTEKRLPGRTEVELIPAPPKGTTIVSSSGQRTPAACEEEPCETSLPALPPSFTMDVTRRRELNRTVLEVYIAFDRPASSVRLFFDTAETAVLYRADTFSDPTIGGRGVRFELQPGNAPPLRIAHSIALILADDTDPVTVVARATFPGSSFSLDHELESAITTIPSTVEEIELTVADNG